LFFESLKRVKNVEFLFLKQTILLFKRFIVQRKLLRRWNLFYPFKVIYVFHLF